MYYGLYSDSAISVNIFFMSHRNSPKGIMFLGCPSMFQMSVSHTVTLWSRLIIFVSITDILLRLCIHINYAFRQTPIDFQVIRSKVNATVFMHSESFAVHYVFGLVTVFCENHFRSLSLSALKISS